MKTILRCRGKSPAITDVTATCRSQPLVGGFMNIWCCDVMCWMAKAGEGDGMRDTVGDLSHRAVSPQWPMVLTPLGILTLPRTPGEQLKLSWADVTSPGGRSFKSLVCQFYTWGPAERAPASGLSNLIWEAKWRIRIKWEWCNGESLFSLFKPSRLEMSVCTCIQAHTHMHTCRVLSAKSLPPRLLT